MRTAAAPTHLYSPVDSACATLAHGRRSGVRLPLRPATQYGTLQHCTLCCNTVHLHALPINTWAHSPVVACSASSGGFHTGAIGTPNYMAPEVIHNKDGRCVATSRTYASAVFAFTALPSVHRLWQHVRTSACSDRSSVLEGALTSPSVCVRARYTFNADIWSLGISLIEMATAKTPFNDFSNPCALMFHIGRLHAPPPLPACNPPPPPYTHVRARTHAVTHSPALADIATFMLLSTNPCGLPLPMASSINLPSLGTC